MSAVDRDLPDAGLVERDVLGLVDARGRGGFVSAGPVPASSVPGVGRYVAVAEGPAAPAAEPSVPRNENVRPTLAEETSSNPASWSLETDPHLEPLGAPGGQVGRSPPAPANCDASTRARPPRWRRGRPRPFPVHAAPTGQHGDDAARIAAGGHRPILSHGVGNVRSRDGRGSLDRALVRDEPSFAVLMAPVPADRAARVHDPVARDEQLDRAVAQGVARRPGRPRGLPAISATSP